MPEGQVLAKGWKRVKFGDVVRLSKARCADPLAGGVERFVGLEHLEPGDLRIRRWGNVADGVTFTSVFRPGQVLFGKRRAYQRKVAVADFSGVCSGDIYVMETKDANVLLPDLLPFICQTDAFFDHAVDTSAGSLSPRTNWSSMSDFEFVLPSVDDQRELSRVFLSIESVLFELAHAHETATALYRATHAVLYSEVLTSPHGKGICEFFDSISDKGFTDLPILSVTIGGEIVRRDSLDRHVSDETGDEKYIRVLSNDLVYNTMRLWQGAIGIVKEVGLISPAYTVLRLKDPSDTPLYWWYLFRSPTVINEYRRFVKGVAKDRWRIYFADLQRLSVFVPTDENRNAVAEKLDEVRNAIQGQLNRRSDLFNLRKHLVERSLGRVNV